MTFIVPRSEPKHTFDDDTKEITDALGDLSEADRQAVEELVRQNSDINLRPDHPSTILEVSNGRIVLSSTRPSYAHLLTMDGEALAAIYRRHFYGGRDGG